MRALICLTLLTTPVFAAPDAALDDAKLSELVGDAARDGAKLVRKLDRLYPGHDSRSKQGKREQVVARWLQARDQALAVIFDTAIYPDEDHGRAGQETVDAHVARVEATYAPLEASQRKDLRKLIRVDADEALALLAELRRLRDRIDDLRGLQDQRGLDVESPLTVAPAVEALLAQRAGDAAAAEALRGELSVYDGWLLQRLADEQVRRANAELLRGQPAEGVTPSAAEAKQVQITNAYRASMGRPALAHDPRLTESARGHSADMTRLDFFSHTSPIAGKEAFSDRIRETGYPNPGGENIYKGGHAPEAAHDGWYHSSGHHRNILGAHWAAMGSGQDGAHWTQNFGR